MDSQEIIILISKVLDINPLSDKDIEKIWTTLSKLFSINNLDFFQCVINFYDCKHRVVISQMLEECLQLILYMNGVDKYRIENEEMMVEEFKINLGFNP